MIRSVDGIGCKSGIRRARCCACIEPVGYDGRTPLNYGFLKSNDLTGHSGE